MTADACPHPADSTPACANGVCTFACATPLLRCGAACCKAVAITAGAAHTCVITSLGGVKCWGAAFTIGDGTFDERLSPADVAGLSSKVVAISAGGTHTCARLDTGAIECWGVGPIGNGTMGPVPSATRAILPGPASQVASGAAHACAIVDGGLFCWGSDNTGQQGTNGGGSRTTPGSVSGLAYDVLQVAAGQGHGCARVFDGGAQCWGFNVQGECGDGVYQMGRNVPVAVTALDAGILELQAGFTFTCARTASGVKCWGNNGTGECGAGLVAGRSLAAVDVVGVGPGLSQLALAPIAHHACVVQDGGVLCWGNGDHGQLGDGALGQKNAPTRALGLDVPIVAVAPGARHTCAVTVEGGVLCWGDNSEGQLGEGKKNGDHLTPVTVR